MKHGNKYIESYQHAVYLYENVIIFKRGANTISQKSLFVFCRNLKLTLKITWVNKTNNAHERYFTHHFRLCIYICTCIGYFRCNRCLPRCDSAQDEGNHARALHIREINHPSIFNMAV